MNDIDYFTNRLEISIKAYNDEGNAAPIKDLLKKLETRTPPPGGDLAFNNLLSDFVEFAVSIKDEAMLHRLIAIVPDENTHIFSEGAAQAARYEWKQVYDVLRPLEDRQFGIPLHGISLYEAWLMDDPSAYKSNDGDTLQEEAVGEFLDDAKEKEGSSDNSIEFIKRIDAVHGQNLARHINRWLGSEDGYGPKNKKRKNRRPCSVKGCDQEAVFQQIEVRGKKHYSVFKCSKGHETLEEKKKD